MAGFFWSDLTGYFLPGQEWQVNDLIQNQGSFVEVEIELSDVILDSGRGTNAEPAIPDFTCGISRAKIPIHG